MEYETIKEKLLSYVSENNLKYLRKSHLADFAVKNGFEIEDINELCERYYEHNFTIFNEKISGTKYRRYIIGCLDTAEIESKTGLKYCNYCNCFSATAIETADGKHFCDNYCAGCADYETCTECNKLVKIHYHYNDIKLCKDCCDTHHEKYHIAKCNRCHKYSSVDRLYKVDTNKHFCSNCVNSLRLIDGYHGHSRSGLWKPRKLKREKSNYFGFENEFEIKNNTPCNVIALGINEILTENNIENFFVFESDGSLHTGFEAISQPFTLAWLYENENKLQPVYDFMLKNGCTAEKTTTAGLHIHFSRSALTKPYSLAKIAFIINRLQYDFAKYSGRKLNNLGYTQFDSFYNRDGDILLKDFKNEYRTNDSSCNNHSAIVNRQHRSTIEIRLFKGTLDLKRIIANVELLSNLIYYVENHTDTQCENVTFKELCLFKKTKYLKSYYYKIFEPNTKIKTVKESE